MHGGAFYAAKRVDGNGVHRGNCVCKMGFGSRRYHRWGVAV